MILKEFGLQLFSVRDYTEKDFIGTLEKIAEMGYTSVEFAGFGDIPAKEMRAALDRLGLVSLGSHSGLDRLTGDNLKREVEYNAQIGSQYVICPWAPMENRDDVLRLCETLAAASEAVCAAGMKLGYHNHNQEFGKDGDSYYFDIMMDTLSPDQLIMELDVFWSEYAGIDTKAYIRKYGPRCEIIHMKQIENHETKKNVELPRGMIDFAELTKFAADCGAKHFIVEQEAYASDSMESAKENADYLLK